MRTTAISRPMVGRIAVAVLLVAVFESPAAAKMPSFDVRLSENVAKAGSAITVTLTFSEDVLGSTTRLDGMLGVFRSVEVNADGRPRPRARPVLPSLFRVRGGVYQGELRLAQPGAYVVVAFPDVRGPLPQGGPDGLPGPLRVTVVGSGCRSRR
jgi:hypothetical protein